MKEQVVSALEPLTVALVLTQKFILVLEPFAVTVVLSVAELTVISVAAFVVTVGAAAGIKENTAPYAVPATPVAVA